MIDRSLLAGTATEVAPRLLGGLIVRKLDRGVVRVRLTEVEAYEGDQDPASHAFRGRTARNSVMFGEAGHLYCYFVYGMHWCANVVCGVEGRASAVLLRAGEVIEGAELVADASRTKAKLPQAALASGPARLARVLGLDGGLTGVDLLDPASVVQLQGLPAPSAARGALEHIVRTGPRVGVAAAAELPLRFWLDGERSVSAYRRGGRRRTTGGGAVDARRQT